MIRMSVVSSFFSISFSISFSSQEDTLCAQGLVEGKMYLILPDDEHTVQEDIYCLADPDLGRLLSSSGIRRGQTKEPLVQDGTVRGGKLVIPEGKSESFCAAGIRKEWEK